MLFTLRTSTRTDGRPSTRRSTSASNRTGEISYRNASRKNRSSETARLGPLVAGQRRCLECASTHAHRITQRELPRFASPAESRSHFFGKRVQHDPPNVVGESSGRFYLAPLDGLVNHRSVVHEGCDQTLDGPALAGRQHASLPIGRAPKAVLVSFKTPRRSEVRTSNAHDLDSAQGPSRDRNWGARTGTSWSRATPLLQAGSRGRGRLACIGGPLRRGATRTDGVAPVPIQA